MQNNKVNYNSDVMRSDKIDHWVHLILHTFNGSMNFTVHQNRKIEIKSLSELG